MVADLFLAENIGNTTGSQLPRMWCSVDFYQRLGIPRSANQMAIDAAFTAWHQKFLAASQTACHVDLSEAKEICEAYHVLRVPQHRVKYDELLTWVHSPAIHPTISDEEFSSWLKPGKSIALELIEKRISEQLEARRLRRVAAAKFQRAISSREPWIGITCWTLTWLSGVAMFVIARFSLHRIFALASKLHH